MRTTTDDGLLFSAIQCIEPALIVVDEVFEKSRRVEERVVAAEAVLSLLTGFQEAEAAIALEPGLVLLHPGLLQWRTLY